LTRPFFHLYLPAALQSLNRLIHINNLAACALYTTKLHAELAAEVPTIYQDEPPTQQLVVRTQNTDPEGHCVCHSPCFSDLLSYLSTSIGPEAFCPLVACFLCPPTGSPAGPVRHVPALQWGRG
jgi:hypothetical protein